MLSLILTSKNDQIFNEIGIGQQNNHDFTGRVTRDMEANKRHGLSDFDHVPKGIKAARLLQAKPLSIDGLSNDEPGQHPCRFKGEGYRTAIFCVE